MGDLYLSPPQFLGKQAILGGWCGELGSESLQGTQPPEGSRLPCSLGLPNQKETPRSSCWFVFVQGTLLLHSEGLGPCGL